MFSARMPRFEIHMPRSSVRSIVRGWRECPNKAINKSEMSSIRHSDRVISPFIHRTHRTSLPYRSSLTYFYGSPDDNALQIPEMRGAENYVVYNHRVPQLFVEARSYGSGRLHTIRSPRSLLMVFTEKIVQERRLKLTI